MDIPPPPPPEEPGVLWSPMGADLIFRPSRRRQHSLLCPGRNQLLFCACPEEPTPVQALHESSPERNDDCRRAIVWLWSFLMKLPKIGAYAYQEVHVWSALGPV